MKNELRIGIGITAIIAIIGAYYAYSYPFKFSPGDFPLYSVTVSPNETPSISGPQSVLLSAAEIAKHATPSDCWIIISGKIYSVTKYLSAHPGGASEITPFCGKDATQGFATRGGTGQHSSRAMQQLGALYIGTVGTEMSTEQIITAERVPLPTNNSRNGDDDEWEDD